MVPICHPLDIREPVRTGGRSVPGMAAQRGLRSAARSVLGLLRRPSRPTSDRAAVPSPDVEYRPRDDGAADPGEIVWAWVPYDEADGRGKDRPVLIIGRRGADLLGLMLSSQDHDRDAADEARFGRIWTDLGTGAWDVRGRPSEVRLDRLLELAPGAVRREGAALDRARFDRVVGEARRVQGW
jgi:hypothetical protein